MRFKIIGLLVCGVLLAMIAGGLSYRELSLASREVDESRAAIAAFGDIVSVPVPRVDLLPGQLAQASDFTTQPIPRRYLPEGVLRELPLAAPAPKADPAPDAATAVPTAGPGTVPTAAPEPAQPDSAPSLRILRPMLAGTLITVDSIGQPQTGEARITTLGPDRHALAITAANLEQLRDDLAPGGKVDLFWTSADLTRLLVQQAEVLSLPQPPGPDSDPRNPPRTEVFLAVPASESARILQVAGRGRVDLALAPAEPRKPVDGVILVSREELAGLPLVERAGSGGPQILTQPGVLIDPNAGVPGPLSALGAFQSGSAPSVCTTALIRGGQRVTVEVPCQ